MSSQDCMEYLCNITCSGLCDRTVCGLICCVCVCVGGGGGRWLSRFVLQAKHVYHSTVLVYWPDCVLVGLCTGRTVYWPDCVLVLYLFLALALEGYGIKEGEG